MCQVMQSEKITLHPRNRHRKGYDFDALVAVGPELESFVSVNEHGNKSIPFSKPEAVRALNTALLRKHYGIAYWDFPENYLCPPIPGRVDYIHHVADLLAESNGGSIPTGKDVRILDLGVGANCIYPILGVAEYNWSFVGTEVDPVALEAARRIAAINPALRDQVEIRQQKYRSSILRGIAEGERFHLCMSNPPFHASRTEAEAASKRKLRNLGLDTDGYDSPEKNFGGKDHELWYNGGEVGFISKMIKESTEDPRMCAWYTSLVSRRSNLAILLKTLKRTNPKEFRVIDMAQGQKVSRILCWRR